MAASKEQLLMIKKRIKKDPKLLRLKKAFDSLDHYNIPYAETIEEVQSLHMLRKTRQLDRRAKTFVQDIIDGMIDDQAKRGRLSEILLDCVKAEKNLKDALDTLRGYLTVEYADLLRSISTKAERTSFLDSHVFGVYVKYLGKVSTIRGAVEIVIIDIDKAGYTYKNLIEAVKMSSGRREVV